MDFAKSLAITVALLEQAGVNYVIHESRNSCFVDMSRNKLIAEFLKSDCTHIWQVDDDMGWNPDAILRMLAFDKEFIAAAGPKKIDSEDEFCCKINVHADETPIVKDGLLSASKVGAAFILLKRSAIQRMIDGYPELKCLPVDEETGYMFFQAIYTQNKWITEDYAFCERFIEKGGEVWIYPDVDFVHTGLKDYKGNYHKFLLGKPKADAKQESDGIRYSIVIVAYKAEEALGRCLSSLIDNPPPRSEIILIDNSPTPIEYGAQLINLLDSKYENVVIHADGKNKGFAEGCNVGARLAKGHTLVFINPDTVVYPGCWDMLGAHLKEGVGAVGPLSNFVAGAQNMACYAHSAKYVKENANAENSRFTAMLIAAANLHAGIETKLLIGFFLMVPKKVWDAVGEFDPGFMLGCDDLDYSMRLREAGYKLIIAPDVFVFHEGHVSFREEGDPALELNRQSETHLRLKLRDKFGTKIPSSVELWGCDIFPTESSDPMSEGMIARADQLERALA